MFAPAVHGIVLTELITGAEGDREAGEFGRKLKTRGISVPLGDFLIATPCLEHNLVLIARDKPFRGFAKYLPLPHSESEGGFGSS